MLRQLDAYGLVTGAAVTVATADASLQAIPVEVGGTIRPIGTAIGRFIWVEPQPTR